MNNDNKKSVNFLVLLMILMCVGTAQAQSSYSVKGKVISSEDGQPIAGASVQVTGTMIGTATSIDGLFRFTGIPEDRTIFTVSAVGFTPQRREFLQSISDTLLVILSPTMIQSEVVVVTANKRPQSLQEVPVSISIVDAKEIEKRNITAADDALRYVPGVNFQQSQINIRASSGYSRGVGSRVMLLIDGLPLLSGDTGEITFESIPVSQIDRMEVVKGAGSALYGSGAMGGVINILTKDISEGTSVRWRMFAGLYSDPVFDQWKWSSKDRWMNGQSAAVGFAADQWKLGVSLQRSLDDGYREQDWNRRYTGTVKVAYAVSPYESVTLLSNLYQQYRGDFLWWKDLKNALRPADAQRNITTTSLRFNNSLRYQRIVSDRFFFDLKAMHFRGNWYRDSLDHTRLDGSISDAFVLDGQGNLMVGNEHHITFGAVANTERVRADIFGRHDGRGGAVYVQEEYTPGKELAVSVGLRYDLQQVIGLPVRQQASPKFGIRYTVNNSTTLRASAGRGFRSPSIGELYTSTKNTGSSAIVIPSTSLRPEHSWSFEIGNTTILSEHLSIEAALFSNEYRDLIEANVQGDTVLKAVTVNFMNITQAEIRGGEIGIHSQWFEQTLICDLHYNYNWAVDAATGAFLRFRPRHIAGVNAEYSFDGISVGADYRFVSRIEAIDEKLVELAPIKNGGQRVSLNVVDARMSAGFSGPLFPFKVSLIVNNVLGYSYNELIGNVSPPRHAMVTLEGMIQ